MPRFKLKVQESIGFLNTSNTQLEGVTGKENPIKKAMKP